MMTNQVLDSVVYKNVAYSLIHECPGLFSPWEQGIFPEHVCTSNGRGYVAYYKVSENKLQLDCLTVAYTPAKRIKNTVDNGIPIGLSPFGTGGALPLLNGVSAVAVGFGYWTYENIDLPLHYTGILTLSEVPDTESCCLELSFRAGCLTGINEISPPTVSAIKS